MVEQKIGERISTLFLPQKKGEPEPISLLPQYVAKWQQADFGERTFMVVSSSQRWLIRLMHHAAARGEKKTDSRTSLAHLCALINEEFNRAVNTARHRVRAQSVLAQAKDGCKEARMSDSSDSSSESADDSSPVDHRTYRQDRRDKPLLQVHIAGIALWCINT